MVSDPKYSKSEDYYELLGLSQDFTRKMLERAFQDRIRQVHPDVNDAKDATRKAQTLNEARRVLRDPGLRKAYDGARMRSKLAEVRRRFEYSTFPASSQETAGKITTVAVAADLTEWALRAQGITDQFGIAAARAIVSLFGALHD